MIGINLYSDNKSGEVVDVLKDDGKTVTFCRQGGGFQCEMASKKFHKAFSTAPEAVMRKGVVSADFLDGENLPCWSDGGSWNGWGMPYFERAEVEKLIAISERIELMPMCWEGNKVVVHTGDDQEREEYEQVTMPDGSLAWGVGAGSWCWDSVVFPGSDPQA